MQTLFKIATWNVNSLRVRLSQVLTWLKQVKPDVLALQETKLTDQDFPIDSIRGAGYEVVFSGQRTYNGMALLSRNPALHIVYDLPQFEDAQRRIIAAVIDGIRILNVYIPNGENVASVKYEYKLNWLKNFDLFLKQELEHHHKLIVVGDFNIAPEDIDVHNPKRWEGKVLFSQPERNAFKEMLEVGLVDCFRQNNPSLQAFSWWDYRMHAFKRNMGLRIDHILASPPLANQCIQCHIDQLQRSVERPSDHAPVVADFKVVLS